MVYVQVDAAKWKIFLLWILLFKESNFLRWFFENSFYRPDWPAHWSLCVDYITQIGLTPKVFPLICD